MAQGVSQLLGLGRTPCRLRPPDYCLGAAQCCLNQVSTSTAPWRLASPRTSCLSWGLATFPRRETWLLSAALARLQVLQRQKRQMEFAQGPHSLAPPSPCPSVKRQV